MLAAVASGLFVLPVVSLEHLRHDVVRNLIYGRFGAMFSFWLRVLRVFSDLCLGFGLGLGVKDSAGKKGLLCGDALLGLRLYSIRQRFGHSLSHA